MSGAVGFFFDKWENSSIYAVDLDPRLIGRRTSLAYILGSISPLGWFLIFFGKFVFVAVLVLFCRRRCCEGGRCCCEKDPATAATAAEVL